WKDAEITLPRRCFLLEPGGKYELHAFADASSYGLGFAIYARHSVTADTGLLFARSLIIPAKLLPDPKAKDPKKQRPISIPRLELQALSLAGKAAAQVRDALDKSLGITLWTDSTTSIQWLLSGIHNHKEVFVRNRLKGLHKFTVKYVPTSENPADLA